MKSLKKIVSANREESCLAVLVAFFAFFLLIPSSFISAATFKIQLSDQNCGSGIGTEAVTSGGWSTNWATDSNGFDADCARISLSGLSDTTDFRVGLQLSDHSTSGGCGQEVGPARYTPWASQGGGDSGWATDANAYDPNCVKIFIDTTNAPTGVLIKNPKVDIELSDDGCGGQYGGAVPASNGSGYSSWASDSNRYDFDCIRLNVRSTLQPSGIVTVLTQGFKADGTSPSATKPAVNWSISGPAGAPSCNGTNSTGKTCSNMPYGTYTITSASQTVGSFTRTTAVPWSQDLGTASAPAGECSGSETKPHRELSGDTCSSVNSCGISECSWEGTKPLPQRNLIFAPQKFVLSKIKALLKYFIPEARASRFCILTVDGGEQCDSEPVGGNPPPPPDIQCSDGRDNDGDGYRDYPADPQCSGSEDNDELNAPEPVQIYFTLQYKETVAPLTVTCSVSPASPAVGDTVTWGASASGGDGTYAYSWTGTDNLSGSSASINKIYSTAGNKTATVTVTSAGGAVSQDCSKTVSLTAAGVGDVVGFHDGFSGNVSLSECRAFGWVAYSADKSTDVSYRVKDGNTVILSGVANLPRSDLASAGVCTNGTCAFNDDLSNLISRGVNHTITVEGKDPDDNLWYKIGTSPKTINCPVTVTPPTVDLVANPATVLYNTSSTLTWTSTNATSCTGTNFSTNNVSNNTTGVDTGALTTAKTYRIDCTGAGGSTSDTVTVNVGSPATVTVSSPDFPTYWTLTGPNAASTKQQTTLSSSRTYTAMTPGSYTLAPDGKAGYTMSITPGATRSVVGGGTLAYTINYDAAPSITFSASPNPVEYNTSSTLTWNVANATSCSASGAWTGTKNVSGTYATPNLTTARTYTLTCTGPGGTDSKSVTVGVLPAVDLVANPLVLNSGQSSTLTWTTNYASTCTASASPASATWTGSKAISGSESTGAMSATRTYTLTCSNSYGNKSDSETVTVGVPPVPTLNLSVSSTSIPYNTAATLTWTSTNATGCTASGGWNGARTTSGSESTGNLTTTTTYTLVCTGPGGTSPTRSVTVNVGSSVGTVVVNSNLPTTWQLNGPTPKTQSTDTSATTYTSMATGLYTLIPGSKSGYSYTISPASSQSLTSGSTITFNITYTAVVVPTVALTADSTNLSPGGSTMLRWTSTNATSCTASNGWSGTKSTSGSESTGALTSDRTYTMVCSNSGVDSVPSSVTVNVGGGGGLTCAPVSQPASTGETVNFSASGGSGTYSWSAPGGSPSTGGNSNTFSSTWSSTGNKTVTVTRGSSSDTCDVNVTSPSPDFSLSNTGNIRSQRSGSSTQTRLIVNPTGGFNQNVSFVVYSTNPALTGATYTFSPITLNSSGYATGASFRVNLPNPVPDGNYTITVRGTSTGSPTIIRSTNIILTVSESGGGGVIPPFEEF